MESEARRKADLNRQSHRLEKSEQEAQKKVKRLCAQKFTAPQTAIEAAQSLAKKLKYHSLAEIQAVELLPDQTKKASVKADKTENITYQIQATLIHKSSVIESETKGVCRFVLATNDLNIKELSNDEMLFDY